MYHFVLRYLLNSQGNKGRRGGLKAQMKLQLIGPGVVHHQPVINCDGSIFGLKSVLFLCSSGTSVHSQRVNNTEVTQIKI